MRKVIFRADAGQNIGYGHFIRSLALANILKDEFDVSFATVNPTDYQKEEMANVCPAISLKQESHFEDFLALLQGDEIVVLDNYFFTTDYQRAIRAKGCRLVCIDDMHDKHYFADVVINHAIDTPTLFSVEPYTRLCLGLQWALLRKPFLDEIATKSELRKQRQVIENIVIAFGGVDTYRLTDKVINILATNIDIKHIDAIVGIEYKSQINDIAKVIFHSAISAQKVASLYLKCDLAIVSASTVCIEALACGAKVAAGYYVDNQKNIYHSLNSNHYIYGLGLLRDLQTIDIDCCNKFNPANIHFGDIADNYKTCFKSIL